MAKVPVWPQTFFIFKGCKDKPGNIDLTDKEIETILSTFDNSEVTQNFIFYCHDL